MTPPPRRPYWMVRVLLGSVEVCWNGDARAIFTQPIGSGRDLPEPPQGEPPLPPGADAIF